MTVLLDIRQLRIAFDTPQGVLHAVNDLSYTVTEGETLGIVGESGSGKTVQALAIAGLLPSPPARIVSGQILFRGRDLLAMDERQLRAVRGAEIGFVFQDPMTALNPVLTIGRQMTEGLRHHEGLGTSAARQRATELLEIVGIPDPRGRLDQYPHQFSGGMRQRVMIAIGVACNPRLLIADEATTALDVTVQAQVLDLVADLKKRWGTTVIWITHDMGVVARIADTVQVMYGGRIMERGPAEAIFHDPRSAYTWGLLRALPLAGAGTARRLYQIPGQPPRMTAPTPGDPFAPRNPFATRRCHQEVPPLRDAEASVPGHQVAAWYDLRAIRRAAGEAIA